MWIIDGVEIPRVVRGEGNEAVAAYFAATPSKREEMVEALTPAPVEDLAPADEPGAEIVDPDGGEDVE